MGAGHEKLSGLRGGSGKIFYNLCWTLSSLIDSLGGRMIRYYIPEISDFASLGYPQIGSANVERRLIGFLTSSGNHDICDSFDIKAGDLGQISISGGTFLHSALSLSALCIHACAYENECAIWQINCEISANFASKHEIGQSKFY